MATNPVRDFLVSYLMPTKCYDEIIVNFHMHVPCLKFILNKACGFWILLDTLLAPFPQLVKILWRGSAAGLSLTSNLLQLYAFSGPIVYAIASNFPLFAWGERLFTLVQSAAIVFLILCYRGDTLKGLLFLLAYIAVMFLLGSCASAAIASMMQASSLPALTASKVIQAGTNYFNGHTGQLSSMSVLLSWAGSLAVVFASLQDTESLFSTVLHLLSACFSCVLLVQLMCYRSSTSKKKTE
ncbi:mannose-P-dolichol utilization defect 1 protein-like [Antennarius striatus]|uniref:mannose-P-dolichol utilization defect 1 protein-like n=1 Tax=Antennarius striatus TaxID=241820 RepID=UPI0035AF8455